MAKKKKKTVKKKVKKKAPAPKKREKGPKYVVQIGDPKMTRKDLLESLREVIIFMQGYEKFRIIQEEKVVLIRALKEEVKVLSSLSSKLGRIMPKGKLKAVALEVKKVEEKPEVPEMLTEEGPVEAPVQKVVQKAKPPSELAALESQLRDIESQLKSIS